MKSSQKITRLQLKVNHNDQFLIFGIVSAEPDYKLSLALNRKFKISLKSSNPVILKNDKGAEILFSKFSDKTDSPELIFNLFSNRSLNEYLLKKLKNVDYIFSIHDSENEKNNDDIATKLREIESISAIFKVDTNKVNDKNLQYITH
jgi:hypothetical protein